MQCNAYMQSLMDGISNTKYAEVLQNARLEVRCNQNFLLHLDDEEWISLIFLILDESTLIERGYNYCQYVTHDRLNIVASSLKQNLIDGKYGASGTSDPFDSIIKALYIIGRFDILVNHLHFCIDHTLHKICKSLAALPSERIALYNVFSELTQDQADRLISLRLQGQWYCPELGKPFELTFCRNLKPNNYKKLIQNIHEALILEGHPLLAGSLHPYIQRKESAISLGKELSLDHVYTLPQEEPHGLCVIINVKEFMPPRTVDDDFSLEPRRGSDIDSDRLCGTFRLFGFTILNLVNPDLEKLQQFFSNLRKDRRLYNIPCLVICVMTHGDDNDNLYLYDRNYIGLTDLRKYCYSESMIGKPRLYFVQACRGDQKLRPMFIQGDSTTTSNTESDCLISAATVGGYSAMRYQSRGSWFITDLCSSLQEIGHSHPLKTVLKETRQKLMKRVERYAGGYVTQISEDKDTLTKEVQFVRAKEETFAEGIFDLTMLEVLEAELDTAVSDFVDNDHFMDPDIFSYLLKVL